jgi:hypothetical protein
MAIPESCLGHLRQLVGVCVKVKYLALYREDEETMLLAQATDKLSQGMWREILRVEHVIPSASLKQAIENARDKGLEEFGSYCRSQAVEQPKSGLASVTPAVLVAHRTFLSTMKLLVEENRSCRACESKRRRL